MTSLTKTEPHMSAEPFTREPGYEYRNGGGKGPTEGWENFSYNSKSWERPYAEIFSFYGDKAWFRRKVPAPAQDGWVKFSDRQPEKYPVLAWSTHPLEELSMQPYHCSHLPCEDYHTHTYWQPMPAPPKAPTQEEIDREAFNAWLLRARGNTEAEDCFLAGAKHGRSTK